MYKTFLLKVAQVINAEVNGLFILMNAASNASSGDWSVNKVILKSVLRRAMVYCMTKIFAKTLLNQVYALASGIFPPYLRITQV